MYLFDRGNYLILFHYHNKYRPTYIAIEMISPFIILLNIMKNRKFKWQIISIISNSTTAIMYPFDAQPKQTYP